jgi:hypothetical protein
MASEPKYKVGDKVFFMMNDRVQYGQILFVFPSNIVKGLVYSVCNIEFTSINDIEQLRSCQLYETLPDLIKKLTADFITKYPNVETD